MTQNQLTELLETEGAKTMIETGEERGFIQPAELEAFALEHELADVDIEELTRELERIGLEVRDAAVEEDKAKEKAEEVVYEADQPSGAGDSLQLFLADVGRHKLLTAAQEVILAKAIERGDDRAKRQMIEGVRRLRRVDKRAGEHRIEDYAAKASPLAENDARVEFQVVAALRKALVREQRTKRGQHFGGRKVAFGLR